MPFGYSMAYAQQRGSKIPQVGILSLADNPRDPRWEAFRAGLQELGYVEGQNIILEYWLAHGDFILLKTLTQQLAKASVDAIMADGVASGQAAAAVIRTTPIVIAALGADPIALGLADSLARPGHNVTGFTIGKTALDDQVCVTLRWRKQDSNSRSHAGAGLFAANGTEKTGVSRTM
jgi:putative ABC transport system substrate-binding protein